MYEEMRCSRTVNPHFRRFGDLERARVHVMLYQKLPLVYVRPYGP
ncbi:hypothetical protein HanPSC8_Chr14g0595581 [Helianthus annuus]|nr:hypothetical protein HanPSC8_Chr14g0595581 [Helianthus annuus]